MKSLAIEGDRREAAKIVIGRKEAMGMFQIKMQVANPADPKKFFEEKFWVDTGAFYQN
jgi:hypothetical protein